MPRTPAHADEAALAALLRRHAEPLPALDDPEFAAAFDRFGDARVVLVGEASHGSSEFYRARAAISRRLIERHGFSIVAVEGDWPDAAAVDAWARGRTLHDWRQTAFRRFPLWMWRNREVDGFVRWLRDFNQGAERPVEFRGLDVYSLGASLEAVLQYLDGVDPDAAQRARQRYGCLTPWQDEPAAYGQRVTLAGKPSCEQAVVEQLRDLLALRLQDLQADDEAFFHAERNARVVLAAEQYYRAMYRGSTASWNLRDRHMFETLRALLEHRGPDAKALVWAHNSHLGNAGATEMGWSGQTNLGELCRTAFGRDAVLIGQSTDRGEVAAADNWDEPMQVKSVLPSRADSWERLFLQAGQPAALYDWRGPGRAELRAALLEPRLERAIGVIYRPRTERVSHYFHAELGEQFDAWLWFEETRAVKPLHGPSEPGVPDTWPFAE